MDIQYPTRNDEPQKFKASATDAHLKAPWTFIIPCSIFIILFSAHAAEIPLCPQGMALLKAKGCLFQMGSTNGSSDEEPVHPVQFSYDFWMDTTEVTQKDYEAVMKVNPSKWKGLRLPVEQATWFDAILFCNAQSKQNGLDTVYSYQQMKGKPGRGCELKGVLIHYARTGYRLPTEAEWEYACRAGTQSEFYWDDRDARDYAWFDNNSGGQTHVVAQKQPNAYGLYDMSGNVWEWCNDWYGAYDSTAQTDPRGSVTGRYKVLRGGSWNCAATYRRSAYRHNNHPGGCFRSMGFRTVLPIKSLSINNNSG